MSAALIDDARKISEAEYLKFLKTSETRYEWFNGMIWPVGNPNNLPGLMAGANRKHQVVKHNIERHLGNQLTSSPCEASSSDTPIKSEISAFRAFPDVVVACEGSRWTMDNGLETLLDPVVIFEVLSSSTATFDRGAKFLHYQRIASLQDYVIVIPDSWHVEHYHRSPNNDWLVHTAISPSDIVVFELIGCKLTLAQIYERVELPAPDPRLPKD